MGRVMQARPTKSPMERPDQAQPGPISPKRHGIGTAHKPGHFRLGQPDQIFNIIYKIIILC